MSRMISFWGSSAEFVGVRAAVDAVIGGESHVRRSSSKGFRVLDSGWVQPPSSGPPEQVRGAGRRQGTRNVEPNFARTGGPRKQPRE